MEDSHRNCVESAHFSVLKFLVLILADVLEDYTIDLDASAIDNANVRIAAPIPMEAVAEAVDANLKSLSLNSLISY